MLKANSKQAKENVRKYIINTFNEYVSGNITEADLVTDDLATVAKIVFADAKKYLSYEGIVTHGEAPGQENFKKYAQILPGYIRIFDGRAWDNLAAILEETNEEKQRFTNSQAEEKLTAIVYRELFNAVIRPYGAKVI